MRGNYVYVVKYTAAGKFIVCQIQWVVKLVALDKIQSSTSNPHFFA